MTEGIVVDSSVVVKWFVKNEPLSLLASRLFEMFKRGERKFVIPDLLFYEVGNVFLRKWPEGADVAEKSLIRLWNLPWFLMPLSDSLLARTFRLASHYQTSFYDMLFLSTAERAEATLYTADEKFLNKVVGVPFVKSLQELE